MTRRRIIRPDGTEEFLDTPITIAKIREVIGAVVFDTALLRHNMLMFISADSDDKQINHGATFLYHSITRPGIEKQIRGNVIVAPDSDFEVGDD